jgi:hypothetical protein
MLLHKLRPCLRVLASCTAAGLGLCVVCYHDGVAPAIGPQFMQTFDYTKSSILDEVNHAMFWAVLRWNDPQGVGMPLAQLVGLTSGAKVAIVWTCQRISATSDAKGLD